MLRDIFHAEPTAIAAERARVATEGWGERLLSLLGDDGQWAAGACFPGNGLDWRSKGEGQPWTSTLPTLQLLVDFGIEPHCARVQEAIEKVQANCRWEQDGQAFFHGEVEPCINGRLLRIGVYFGQNMRAVAERLLSEQLDDGGWNCEAENGSVRSSFATTINVLGGPARL